MTQLVLLHTNDIHGQVEGLARVATVVERIRAESDCPVLYVDAGDVEETTTRISNLTKGAAMHRLLTKAGCDAAAVGNASWYRYGAGVLREHAAAAGYPLLLANLRGAEGVRPAVLLEAGSARVGVVGITSPMTEFAGEIDFGLEPLPEVEVVLEHARMLREAGADLVVCLSHLGLDVPAAEMDDRRLAGDLQGEVDVIVGAHSHDLLPAGEWIGDVLVAHAGSHAEYLGRIDVEDGALRASVLAVGEDVPPHPAVLGEVTAIEPEVTAILSEVVGELPQGVGVQWIADVIRERMGAEVAILTAGQALTGELRPGPLRRGELWEACDSSANPGTVEMTGLKLRAVISRGREPEFMRSTAGPLRGRPRGYLHVSGLDPDVIDPARVYRVAGTDWELEPYGGLVEAEWGLRPAYDFPTIVREAIEEHLALQRRSEAAS